MSSKNDYYIDNLTKLGLTESEVKVYLSLLKGKAYTASEVAKISGVLRSKVYEILNRLIQKGLCVEILGSVKKYSASNPESAFQGLVQQYSQQYKQEVEKRKVLAANMVESLLKMYLSNSESPENPLDYIKVTRERNSICNIFRTLEEQAEREVLSLITKPLAMNLSNLADENSTQIASMKRGVVYKSIYEADMLLNEEYLHSVDAFAAEGEIVKVCEVVPIKIFIFDELNVMFTLEDVFHGNKSLTSIIIKHKDLAKGLKLIFLSYWDGAITLEQFKKDKGLL